MSENVHPHAPDRRYARAAGLLYLGIIISGISAEVFLRAPLIDWDSALETENAVRSQPLTLPVSLLADLAMAAFDVALAVLLFRMLTPVNATLALLAMVFRLVQMTIVAGSGLLIVQASLTPERALPLLTLHAAGYDLGLVFFGIATLLLATVFLRHRLTSRGLAIAMVMTGSVYIAGSLLRIVAPELLARFEPAYLVALVTESALCIWLLRGAPSPRHQTRAARQ